jgi:hypothetical protein
VHETLHLLRIGGGGQGGGGEGGVSRSKGGGGGREHRGLGTSGTQFTCFTSTKVQILTLVFKGASTGGRVLRLLALLVQKYTY